MNNINARNMVLSKSWEKTENKTTQYYANQKKSEKNTARYNRTQYNIIQYNTRQ